MTVERQLIKRRQLATWSVQKLVISDPHRDPERHNDRVGESGPCMMSLQDKSGCQCKSCGEISSELVVGTQAKLESGVKSGTE